jgi:two-component system NarL family sensor kinase
LDGLSKRSGIKTFLDVQPPAFPRLTAELETAIFRIVQEALTNVYRHSGAQKAWVTLEQAENRVLIKIRDDGKGIDDPVAELRPGSIGIGIGGMSQRAKEFGGELRLVNVDPGTLVEVAIPSLSAAAQRTHAMV